MQNLNDVAYQSNAFSTLSSSTVLTSTNTASRGNILLYNLDCNYQYRKLTIRSDTAHLGQRYPSHVSSFSQHTQSSYAAPQTHHLAYPQ